MNRFIAALTLSLVCLTGCGKSEPPSGQSASADPPPPKTASPPNKTPTKKASVKPPLEERIYGGLKHHAWPARIKDLDPTSSDAIAAVDGLIALVADHDVPIITRSLAAIALGRIGKPAALSVPVFVRLIEESGESTHEHDIRVATWAVHTLGMLGPVAKPATAVLSQLIVNNDRPVELRSEGIETLGRIGVADAQAVGALIKMLTFHFDSSLPRADKDLLRCAAIDSIAGVGPLASAAIPNLIRLTRRSSEQVRRKAATALGAMGTTAQDAIRPLAELLMDYDSPAVQDAAADALAKTGELGMPILLKLVEDEDVSVKRRAVSRLGLMGDVAKPALDKLDFALDDPDGWVRIHAAESIWKLTNDPDRVVAAYVEELKNPDRQIRIKAYRLLRALGPKAKSAAIPLKRMLTDGRGYVRSVAARALRDIESLK